MEELKKEIEEIKIRNKKVELDKKWETSLTRKLCICVLTYIVVVIYSYLINNVTSIWLSSLVPVMGFLLSTLSLKLIRKLKTNINKLTYVIIIKEGEYET